MPIKATGVERTGNAGIVAGGGGVLYITGVFTGEHFTFPPACVH